jgi:hypothetical protein
MTRKKLAISKAHEETPENPLKPFRAGGAATAGGINFQAAVTAICSVQVARGQPLNWLSGSIDDVPNRFHAETGGAGDDLGIEYRDGSSSEVQIKKGLRAGKILWDTLKKLTLGIHEGEIDYGVLVVCPNTSQPIRQHLAEDLVRLGTDRTDNLREHARTFTSQLASLGLPAQKICSRLRIITVHALDGDTASINTAQSELGHLCVDHSQIVPAWDCLYRDASKVIGLRAARSASDILQILKSSRIQISANAINSPAALINQLTDWVSGTNCNFPILGTQRPLSIDNAWIPITVRVREEVELVPEGMAAALEEYHAWNRRGDRDQKEIEAATLGQFYRHAVIVAGPGMGKSTLITKLAKEYASEGQPVLKVSLRAVAQRMRTKGEAFEESVFALALDGSGILVATLKDSGIHDWVLLCDGLDECGASQNLVAEGLIKFAAGHTQCRAIVTTRPIGYVAAHLSEWRHYEITALKSSSVTPFLANLIQEILGPDDERFCDVHSLAKSHIENSGAAKLITRSPLLLGIAASLIVRNIEIGETKSQLYTAVFRLFDEDLPIRAEVPRAGNAVLRRVLDMLGWAVIESPIRSINTMLDGCAEGLSIELECPKLKAKEIAEECLKYWQEVGLLEKVRHKEEEVLTFVHKTFAEYAAARYLVEYSEEGQAEAVEKRIGETEWTEVLCFAASMGLGDMICKMTLQDTTDAKSIHAAVLKCLELAQNSNPLLKKHLLENILDLAVKELQSERREWSFDIGEAMLALASRVPDLVGRRVQPLLDDAQSWTKLAAWACVMESGGRFYNLESMRAALRDLPQSVSINYGVSLGGGLRLGAFGQNLAQSFALNAARVTLEQTPELADKLLPDALGAESLNTFGFHTKLEELLGRHGKEYKIGVHKDGPSSALRRLLNPSEGYDEARLHSYEQIFGAIIGDDDRPIAEPASSDLQLLNVAAFFAITGYWNSLPNEVWAWSKKYDQEAAHEVLQQYVRVSELPLDKLIEEAKIFLEKARSAPDNRLVHVFGLTPSVDVPLPVWHSAHMVNADPLTLEKGIYHGSMWLKRLAAWLLSNHLGPDELAPVVSRLLTDGRNYTLQIAAVLATYLDRNVASELVRERLREPLVPGCRYLFELLSELDITLDDLGLDVLRRGLLDKDPETAVSAAGYAEMLTNSNEKELLNLLKEAYAHWQSHEEPYPENVGTIPTSPRKELLTGILAMHDPGYVALKSYSADPRSDVNAVAATALVGLLGDSSPARVQFAEEAAAGQAPLWLVKRTLVDKVSFSTAEVEKLKTLLTSKDPKTRFAAMGLLERTYLSESEIESITKRLTKDPELEISDAAYRMLE